MAHITKDNIKEFKSTYGDLLNKYEEYSKMWLTSGMSAAEEKKSRYAFIDTFRDELGGLLDELCGQEPGAEAGTPKLAEGGTRTMLKDAGLWELAKDFYGYSCETKMQITENAGVLKMKPTAFQDDPAFNAVYDDTETDEERAFRRTELRMEDLRGMIDDSLTEAQKRNLRDVRKWMYKHGSDIGLSGKSDQIRFFDNFMKQPLGVQLKTIYLVNTNRRKAPDTVGIDSINSQQNEEMTVADFKQRINRSRVKSFFTASHVRGQAKYWNKLEQALQSAKKDEEKLNAFRDSEKAKYEKAEKDGILKRPAEAERLREESRNGMFEALTDRDAIAAQAVHLHNYMDLSLQLRTAIGKIVEIDGMPDTERNKEINREAYKAGMEQILAASKKIKDLFENDAETREIITSASDSTKDNLKDGRERVAKPTDFYDFANKIVENGAKIKYGLDNGFAKADPEKDDVDVFSGTTLIKSFFKDDKKYKLYDRYTDGYLGAIGTLGNIADICEGIGSVAKWNAKTPAQRAESIMKLSSALGTGVKDTAELAGSLMEKFFGISEKAPEVVNATLTSKIAGVFASSVNTLKNTYQMFKSGFAKSNNRTQQTKLKTAKNGKLRAAVRMDKKTNFSKAVKYGVLALGAAGATAAGVMSLPCVAVGAGTGAALSIGAAALETVTTKVAERKMDNNRRKVAVTSLLKEKGGTDLQDRKQEAMSSGRRLKTMDYSRVRHETMIRRHTLLRFHEGSKETKLLNDHANSKTEMERVLGHQAVAEAGCLNSLSYAKHLYKENMNEAFLYVFFKNPDRGFTIGNLRSEAEMTAEFGRVKTDAALQNAIDGATDESVKKKLNYYQFLKNAGVKMEASKAHDDRKKLESITGRRDRAVDRAMEN